MTKKSLLFFVTLFHVFSVFAQEINTDEIYFQALEEYRKGNYQISLELTTTGLEAAPNYHDIRILRVRNKFALKQSTVEDVDYLLIQVPNYEGVKSLALQQLQQMKPEAAQDYLNRLIEVYPEDPEIKIKKAQWLLKEQHYEEARQLAMEVYASEGLTDGHRYTLHQLLNLTVKNAVQVTGQYIGFCEDYSRTDPWYSISTEYQHNFSHLALIGRATYSDRSYRSGSLYELEAYPIFSEKFYAFTNLGFSDGSIFPDFRGSASVFYNFAPSFEAEAGIRTMFYNQNSYLTGIVGLTTYTGRLYLNARAFVGPQRHEQLLQNYQFNIRYYLSTPENYIFGRLGSGFSPDEPTAHSQVLDNPTLEALYVSAGINKTLGIHHVISASGGILSEDISAEKNGTQLTASLGYRYKF